MEKYLKPEKEKMDLDMIQFLFQMVIKELLLRWAEVTNIKLTIEQKLLKKLKDFFKFIVFHFIKI